MNFTDEALQILSGKLSGVKSREEMEAMLLTMIRVALRTGLGRPEIVRWVKETLAARTPTSSRADNVDCEEAAPPLARLLCSQMLQHVRVQPARWQTCETVVGL